MTPLLLHGVLLALYAGPILYVFFQGQPSHQATAGAWVLGLLFVAAVWLAQAVLSSLLLYTRHRKQQLTMPSVIGMHLLSAVILIVGLKVVGWVIE